MKRLVIFSDGTWNHLNLNCPSNIVKLLQLANTQDSRGVQQVLYYDSGLGTESGLKDKLLGGAIGYGIDKNIIDLYKFLCCNYVEGDEVYLFGFSRGAYTIRSLAGMIYCSGLLPHYHIDKTTSAYKLYRSRYKPSSIEASSFRLENNSQQINITLLTCFDTVGSLGIPSPVGIASRKYQFHDTKLNRKIQHAIHAVALDEIRQAFKLTPMQAREDTKLAEKWFVGHHGCVGGGTKCLKELSNIPLLWVVKQIGTFGLGLEFDTKKLLTLKTNLLTPFSKTAGLYCLLGFNYRTIPSIEMLHSSVLERYKLDTQYNPRVANQKEIQGLNILRPCI